MSPSQEAVSSDHIANHVGYHAGGLQDEQQPDKKSQTSAQPDPHLPVPEEGVKASLSSRAIRKHNIAFAVTNLAVSYS